MNAGPACAADRVNVVTRRLTGLLCCRLGYAAGTARVCEGAVDAARRGRAEAELVRAVLHLRGAEVEPRGHRRYVVVVSRPPATHAAPAVAVCRVQ